MPLSQGVSVSELDAEYKRISEELKFRVDIISMNQNGFGSLVVVPPVVPPVVSAVVPPVVPPVIIDLSRSDRLSSDTDLTTYSQDTLTQFDFDRHLCNFPPGVHKFRPQVSRLKLRVSQAKKLRPKGATKKVRGKEGMNSK